MEVIVFCKYSVLRDGFVFAYLLTEGIFMMSPFLDFLTFCHLFLVKLYKQMHIRSANLVLLHCYCRCDSCLGYASA